MVLDRAGWHGAKALQVPPNVTLVPLPPYSPQLNPMERVWLWLRERFLSLRVFADFDAIVDACCRAWNAFANDPSRIRPSASSRGSRRSLVRRAGMMRLDVMRARPKRRGTPRDDGERSGIADNLLARDFPAMKSFFSSLKTERTARKVYCTCDEARADAFDCIERFHNPRRRHSKLSCLSPMAFKERTMHTKPLSTEPAAGPKGPAGPRCRLKRRMKCPAGPTAFRRRRRA